MFHLFFFPFSCQLRQSWTWEAVMEGITWIDMSEVSTIRSVFCVAVQERIQNPTYLHLLCILVQQT